MGIYLNPGNDGFAEAIRSEIYVDKTGLVKDSLAKVKASLEKKKKRTTRVLVSELVLHLPLAIHLIAFRFGTPSGITTINFFWSLGFSTINSSC